MFAGFLIRKNNNSQEYNATLISSQLTSIFQGLLCAILDSHNIDSQNVRMNFIPKSIPSWKNLNVMFSEHGSFFLLAMNPRRKPNRSDTNITNCFSNGNKCPSILHKQLMKSIGMEAESRMLVARVCGEGNRDSLFNGYKVSVVQTKLSSGDQLCNTVSIVKGAVV